MSRGSGRGGILALYGSDAATIADKTELAESWTVTPIEEDKALPRAVRPALDAADALVLYEPMSFPFESIHAAARSVPLYVVDGEWHGSQELLEAPLFDRFTPYDALVIADDERWKAIQRRFRLMDHQRLNVDPSDVSGVLTAVVRHLSLGPGAGQVEELPAGAPLVTGPALSIDRTDPGWARRLKSWHIVQAEALSSYLDGVALRQPASRSMAIVEVGAGVGRIIKTLPASCERFHGYDVDKENVKTLARSFPRFHFGVLESHLRLPVEQDRFDVAICATEIARNPDHLLARLVEEMVRAVRPGGRLVFVGDFVSRRREEGGGARIGIRRFCDVAERGAGRVLVLDHVEALRYPDEDIHRGALLAFSAAKVTGQW